MISVRAASSTILTAGLGVAVALGVMAACASAPPRGGLPWVLGKGRQGFELLNSASEDPATRRQVLGLNVIYDHVGSELATLSGTREGLRLRIFDLARPHLVHSVVLGSHAPMMAMTGLAPWLAYQPDKKRVSFTTTGQPPDLVRLSMYAIKDGATTHAGSPFGGTPVTAVRLGTRCGVASDADESLAVLDDAGRLLPLRNPVAAEQSGTGSSSYIYVDGVGVVRVATGGLLERLTDERLELREASKILAIDGPVIQPRPARLGGADVVAYGVGSGAGGSIVAIRWVSPIDGQLVRRLELPAAARCFGLGTSPDVVWWIDDGLRRLSRIDPATGASTAVLDLPEDWAIWKAPCAIFERGVP